MLSTVNPKKEALQLWLMLDPEDGIQAVDCSFILTPSVMYVRSSIVPTSRYEPNILIALRPIDLRVHTARLLSLDKLIWT